VYGCTHVRVADHPKADKRPAYQRTDYAAACPRFAQLDKIYLFRPTSPSLEIASSSRVWKGKEGSNIPL